MIEVETTWIFFSKQADGQAFRCGEVQKSAREFSNGLKSRLSTLVTKIQVIELLLENKNGKKNSSRNPEEMPWEFRKQK